MFAFDELGVSFIGFLIHLIPTFLVIATIFVTKKHRVIGAGSYTVLFLGTVIFFKTYEDIIVFILVSLPIAILAFLIIMDLAHHN